MLGQPASSQTVCRPSRRTSDFSSVYSGPVLSRVLIHSGLRSMGTWLLRTSSRNSLRPEGSTRELGEGAGAGVLVGVGVGGGGWWGGGGCRVFFLRGRRGGAGARRLGGRGPSMRWWSVW